MINFDSNNFIFNQNPIDTIENCLESTGYVRIQFSPCDLPSNIEQFFIDIIEKLGGQCLTHNEDQNSLVWHVHPTEKTSNETVARSHTSDEFPFHTDCSYEEKPPEYMALFVLEEDHYGGGQLEIISLQDILEQLSEQTKEILLNEKFRILIPNEFRKCSNIDHINASILFERDKIRFRSDILPEQNFNEHLNELNSIINKVKRFQPKLSQYSMIILNNQKYLHARTQILDSNRHLLRIRFNRSSSFDVHSVYDRNKFKRDYLTFSNEFYDYFDEQFENLYEICKLILKEYFQPTDLGEFIRETFDFDEKIQWILNELNVHRAEFSLGSYRPDILFTQGDRFQINGKYSFEPKISEINARFTLNAFFLAAALCSNNRQNRYSNRFSSLIETIIEKSQFDLDKHMFILKSKEHGYDIHLFQQYWQRKSSKQCFFIEPTQLIIRNDRLIDQKTNFSIEQCLFELHQSELVDLPKSILEYFIRNREIKYSNDFRTIFILHDKRLLSLLSNEQFLYSLLNKTSRLIELIPKTFIIKNLSNYFLRSILETKSNWIVKANSSGKGQDVYLGKNLSTIEWTNLLSDNSHRQWIVQQYFPSIQYESLNLSGMLFCFHNQTFNLGMIRISPNDIVNISDGGFYIRPYVHRAEIHSNRTILTKDELHEQLLRNQSIDSQWNRSVYVSSSGGSGGKRLFFLTDIKQNRLQRKMLAELMIDENVLSQRDICLNLFQTENVYRSADIFNDFCGFVNSTTIPMGANANDQNVLEIIQYFQPNILMGSPYRLMQFAFFLDKQKNFTMKFDKIFFACESLTQMKRDYLAKMFNCSIFIGFYGSAEAGVFACQSAKYSSTNVYLYPKDLVQIEIVNSKIIVTNLIRKRNQLIRFDAGDLGELIPTDHLNYGLLRVFNSQRLIMIENDVLSKRDFEQIMNQFDFIEWQIVIDYVPNTDRKQISILFRYVVEQSTVSQEFIQENIRICLLKCFKQSLSQLHDKLTILFQSIQFEQLFRDQISNKLLKIIDKRS